MMSNACRSKSVRPRLTPAASLLRALTLPYALKHTLT